VVARGANVVVALVVLLGTGACAARRTEENHTFFQTDETGGGATPFEVAVPALDLPAQPGGTIYVGVAVLGSSVRFSRPSNWRVRRASTAPGHRFIEYVSPHEYLFAVYERSDSTTCSSWSDVLPQYEDDAKKHVEWEGKAIPIAGYDTQGREYVLRRKVRGQRAPYVNTSREFIFQGRHSYALVEFVHQGQSDASLEAELLKTVRSLSVL
jgi:hypothetical protein